MSRVGKKAVPIPAGVKIQIAGGQVSVAGPLGQLTRKLPPTINVEVKGAEALVTRSTETKRSKQLHGTIRSLIAGMVEGVTKGFVKNLEIQGVGFRAQLQGQKLTIALGFSHPIEYMVPAGIKLKVPDQTTIVVEGSDKQLVGLVSARLRAYYPAEPYKGKGIRYKDEHVRRKAGKTVA